MNTSFSFPHKMNGMGLERGDSRFSGDAGRPFALSRSVLPSTGAPRRSGRARQGRDPAGAAPYCGGGGRNAPRLLAGGLGRVPQVGLRATRGHEPSVGGKAGLGCIMGCISFMVVGEVVG
jgi:hypothetical protein